VKLGDIKLTNIKSLLIPILKYFKERYKLVIRGLIINLNNVLIDNIR